HVRFGTVMVPKQHRLKTITTPIGVYTLGYLPDYDPSRTYAADNDPMLPSRLQSIGYCAGGACLQSLQFNWRGGHYAWGKQPDLTPGDTENSYALPSAIERYGNDQKLLHGTQFVDLNGDGRPDFVESIGDDPSVPGMAWENNGHGWTPRPEWALPAKLAMG